MKDFELIVKKNEVMNVFNRCNYEFKTTAFDDLCDVLIKNDEIVVNGDDLNAFVSKVIHDKSVAYHYTLELMLSLAGFKKYLFESYDTDSALLVSSAYDDVELSARCLTDQERGLYIRDFLENNREFYGLLCGV